MVKIPVSYNSIDLRGVNEVVNAYKGLQHNRIVQDFEAKLAALTGCNAIALNSGTAAIHLALRALDVVPGDLIIAPSFTYVATINPITYLGASPVFIDVEPTTWNLDPDILYEALTSLHKQGKRPKAIIVVHNYGMPADINQILSIAAQFEIPVIEDAAESIGSSVNSKMTGSMGYIGILSFNNNKILTTFGGGALLSRNVEITDKVIYWATQAREKKHFYEHREIGYNYRMGPLNAAYGLAQLSKLPDLISERRKTFSLYLEALGPLLPELQIEKQNVFSNRWLSTFAFPHESAPRIIEFIINEKIEYRPLWNPMNLQPVFKSYTSFDRGVASDLFKRGVCMPSQESSAKLVINALDKLWGYKKT